VTQKAIVGASRWECSLGTACRYQAIVRHLVKNSPHFVAGGHITVMEEPSYWRALSEWLYLVANGCKITQNRDLDNWGVLAYATRPLTVRPIGPLHGDGSAPRRKPRLLAWDHAAKPREPHVLAQGRLVAAPA
jgi:hypothetical protein